MQEISGCVRREKEAPTFKLQYYLYDVVMDKPFKERLDVLNQIAKDLDLPDFDPNRIYSESDLRIQMVPHAQVSK